MRPFQRSPCSVCRRFMIEHDGDPEEVLCGSCDRAVRHMRAHIAAHKTPPPTVEYRKAPGRYDWSMTIVAVAFGSLGFIVGFLVRGGS